LIFINCYFSEILKKMSNAELREVFDKELSTALITDACIRNGFPLRMAPFGIHSILPGCKIAGAAICVRHFGSVDVYIENMHLANDADIFVIDNNGRLDEGCIGDLTVLEARANKIQGIVVWGVHRDTAEIKKINFPVFSYGAFALGPTRLDFHADPVNNIASFGKETITGEDYVFADDDGITFVHKQYLKAVIDTAVTIATKERRQAEIIADGTTLHEQFDFDKFVEARKISPELSFRSYLRKVGGAIEE
jgi:4-hydroxy-4-methyl-2-oxoglutarate aldolase